MKKLIFFFLLALVMGSCTSEDDLLLKNNEPSSSSGGYKVSLEDAVERARKAVGECGPVATRSGLKARVDVIRSKPLTRSAAEMPDTLLYVVNFEDNGGFAVVGADERVLPIYAVSDSGELNITEDSNEALKLVMEGIEEDAAMRIASMNLVESGGLDAANSNVPGTSPRFPNHFYGWETSHTSRPLLSFYQSRVHYNDEYSKYIFTADGYPTLSGCGAVALEQLLSFYKWPTSIDGYNIDWDKIDKEKDVDAVAKILYLLGQQKYLQMSYKVEEGTHNPCVGEVWTNKIYETLQKLNYSVDSYYTNFLNNESLAREILKNDPLFMFAQAIVEKSDGKLDVSGHYWIIDGWKCYEWVTPLMTDPDEDGLIVNNHTYELDPKGYLYHCVWGGRDGDCNGFYYITTVDNRRGFYGEPDEFWSRDPRTTTEAQWHNHNNSIEFLNNVKPLR